MLTLLKYVVDTSWKEILDLAHNSIVGVEPNYQRFPCLKSLSLSYVSISALDLNLFVSACPSIEALELVNLEIAMSGAQVTVELSSSTLKSVYVEAICLNKFILEAHWKGFLLSLIMFALTQLQITYRNQEFVQNF
ncbi:F-box/LRR-repeat protein [Trifolium repens]|jgi:hypothetical protein|nr:F-box/LRR-repeat protein [Trifolium repens]